MDMKYFLNMAEIIDAYRIVPRVVGFAYIILVARVVDWFMSIPTFPQIQCDDRTMSVLLSSNISLESAERIACNVIGVVGGPTSQQTMLVTAIAGLSTAIFGFYVSTGRDWSRKQRDDNISTSSIVTKPKESVEVDK